MKIRPDLHRSMRLLLARDDVTDPMAAEKICIDGVVVGSDVKPPVAGSMLG